MSQPQGHTAPFPPPLTPSHPLGVAEPQAELPAPWSSFPFAVCFNHGHVYTSVLLSQFLVLSLSLCFISLTGITYVEGLGALAHTGSSLCCPSASPGGSWWSASRHCPMMAAPSPGGALTSRTRPTTLPLLTGTQH